MTGLREPRGRSYSDSMTRPARLLPLIVLAALVVPACKREAPAGAPRYPLKGTVVEVDAASRKVTIAHEDIPGFMPAMTMLFVVLEKDAALLRVVGPGDEITATLVAPDSRYWIEDLVVVKKGVPDPSATPGPRAHEPVPKCRKSPPRRIGCQRAGRGSTRAIRSAAR